ncbi:MAG: HAD family phosphatase [Muribaculaceae bacterium]|nr:HAD family phosphatase [Muribaculaceae bacterium]
MKENGQGIGFLFDLDGVIIDSESQYSKIWRQINLEFPTGVENLEQVIKGCTLSKILNDHFETEETRTKVSKRLHELEDQMHYEYLPFAREFLVELKKRNLPCVLVTSSDNQKMRHLRDEIEELTDFFDFIVTGDLVKTSKPSPEGYLLGASKLNIPPQKCVVFEDSMQGVMAGQNAGSYVVGIIGTLTEEKILPYSNIVINNFNELDLDNLIQELRNR